MSQSIEVLDKLEQSKNLIWNQLRQVIVGQEAVINQVMMALMIGGHCLLEGVPGLGKTLIIKTLAQILELKFNRVQFTPDLMPADIIGTEVIEENRTTGQRQMRFIILSRSGCIGEPGRELDNTWCQSTCHFTWPI